MRLVFLLLLIISCTCTSFTINALNWLEETDSRPFVQQYVAATTFAIQDINNDPNILPGIELLLQNTAHQGSTSIAISRMLEYDRNNVTLLVGNQLSSVSEFTGIVGNVYGIAQLSAVVTSPLLSNKRQYPYYSRMTDSSNNQALAIIDAIEYYASTGRGWTEVAVIASSESYGINLSSFFIEETTDSNIEILTYEQILPEETDIDVELREIKNSGARVFTAFIFSGWELLIERANEFGLVGENYVWFVPNTIVGIPEEVNHVKELTRGVLGTTVYVPPDSPEILRFLGRWFSADTTEYPGTASPPSPFSLFGYDMMFATAFAIASINERGLLDAQRIAPDVWTEAIRDVTFTGVTGIVQFDSNGDRISPYTLSYYSPESSSWIPCGLWSEGDYTQVSDVVWFSNTTTIPDLDIRKPFSYWSCHDKEKGYDPTGKEVTLHTPDSRDVDDIDYNYHCDQFIDCQNLSDESVDCGSNYLAVFIVFAVIAGILVLVACLLLVFIVCYGFILNFRRVRASSPYFLLIMILSIILGYLSIFAWYGKPHSVACGFQPWLLGVSVTSMISTLCVKNFRIWRIFRSPLRRVQIKDWKMMLMYIGFMLPALLILTLWTIIATPTASLEDRDGEDHYVCNTGGFTGEPGGVIFFFILVGYDALLLMCGVFLSVVTRNVPSIFNEAKLIAISIYNLVLLSIVIIPVFFVVQPFNPFLAWILRTIAILYAFTATMVLQFFPKVFVIVFVDKFANQKNLDVTGHSTRSSF